VRTAARRSLLTGALLVGASGILSAQPALPLAPIPQAGLQPVSPFFEGWYLNPDGSYTFSFGYLSRNMEEAVDVPIGPDNFIDPAQFDGSQPTWFGPVRDRGVFGIIVPADVVASGRDVVWTLRTAGATYRVPGRAASPAYELSTSPMAAGSMAPAIRLQTVGEAGRGPSGIRGTMVEARAGQPIYLRVWVDDDLSTRESDVPLNVAWYRHQGPGAVSFEKDRVATSPGGGEASTLATFASPGEYIVRVRVDNFAASDSNPADQCCWSNAYIPVRVR
jgi:hypothetical protein